MQGALSLEGTPLKVALNVYLAYVDCIVFGTLFSGTPDKSLQLCCAGSRQRRRHSQVVTIQWVTPSKESLITSLMLTALYSELYSRELLRSRCNCAVQGAGSLEGTALKFALSVYLTYVNCIVFGTLFSGTPDESLQLCCAGSRQPRRYRQVVTIQSVTPSKDSLITYLMLTSLYSGLYSRELLTSRCNCAVQGAGSREGTTKW